jgi:hypothetical protein
MAILMVLAGIAISGLSDSAHNARQITREMLRTHLQQARAHAIATRHHTALVIPDRDSGKSGLRAISLIEVEHVDGGYAPIRAEHGIDRPLQRWTKLPQNFHFVTHSMVGSHQPTVLDHDHRLTVIQGGVEIRCHMIVFAPNGQITSPSSGAPIQIAIARVVRNESSFRILEKSGHEPVFDLLLVNRLTAKTRNITP